MFIILFMYIHYFITEKKRRIYNREFSLFHHFYFLFQTPCLMQGISKGEHDEFVDNKDNIDMWLPKSNNSLLKS